MKDFELDKYSNGLVSNRKSLIRSNYKMTSYCNSSEKRYNVPVPGSNPNPNDNSKDNDNGNLNSLSHMKLPERPNFTTSTISLIVNVPSLSYVNEYIDDDDEDLSNNEMYKLNLNDNQQICPICNTICTELQQQFDDLQLKRSFSLSSIHDTTYNDTTNDNNNNSNITRPRLWDILESFTMNSSNTFCQFHKYLSVYYNKIVSITRNTTNTTTNNNSSSSSNHMGSNLTNSLSLPCLSNIDEQLMISTIYNENDILHSNNNNNHNHNMIYNRKIEKTPSISIEYVEDNENIFISSNNSQEQLINQKLSDETKNKCETWLKTC